MLKKIRVVILGSGNLATNLGFAIKNAGFEVSQIFGRTMANAELLAGGLGCTFTCSPADLYPHADIYILAVSDNALDEVLGNLDLKGKFIVHCSGSTGMELLKNYSERVGVFYPLQTFSKNKIIDFVDVPVFVEAGDNLSLLILKEVASRISEKVSVLDSAKRIQLHLAAVFASNFVNHLYEISKKILDENNIPFDHLKPLITEVANKVITADPFTCQTGPAVRNDRNIIEKHLKLLELHPDFKNIYTFVSESIYELHIVNKDINE